MKMKNDTNAALSESELTQKIKRNGQVSKFFLGIGILSLISFFAVMGYNIGKDAATGGKGEFEMKPFLIAIFVSVFMAIYAESKSKELKKELHNRK